MKKYFKVVDHQKPVKQNYFKIALCRNKRVVDLISFPRWVWLTFIEFVVGDELLENFITTASYSGCPEDNDKDGKFGLPQQLNLHIPSGLLNNIFRKHILQVLYYKYYLQYLFLSPVGEPNKDFKDKTIDVTRVRFRFQKDLLYLVIAFRRIYLLFWIIFNVFIDLNVYWWSDKIEWALLCALLIEAFRRLKNS